MIRLIVAEALAYTWEEIEQNWLGYSQFGPQQEIVTAFNTVERLFGRDWIEATRVQAGVIARGAHPTLNIVSLGNMLALITGALNSEGLLERVKRGDPGAYAELTAAYLIRSAGQGIELEIEPTVMVDSRTRKPDSRVRRTNERWTYVEVTHPQTSRIQADIHQHLQRLTRLTETCNGSFSVEVFLTRDASTTEVELVAAEIVDNNHHGFTGRLDLPSDLGSIYWNIESPGNLSLGDHDAPYTPRLGVVAVAQQENGHRQVVVRWPFTDKRAEAFLDYKRKQLPENAPGLIVIQTSGAVGAMKAWRGLIERRFQPNMYRRISAVCLLTCAYLPTEAGETSQLQVKLITNPHARFPLPTWLSQHLAHFPSQEPDI
jgi:hypothetical protein